MGEVFLNGTGKGVQGLNKLGRNDIRKIEPAVTASRAFHSINTRILDTHSVIKQLHNEACSSGVIFSLNNTGNEIERERGGYFIGIANDHSRFHSRIDVNSAGLSSDRIAELSGFDIGILGYRLECSKGSYFPIKKNRL